MAIPEIYIEIYAQYLKDLRVARTASLVWWNGVVVDQFLRIGVSRADAEHQARLRWPLGPTSYPRVLAVFRKYFIAISKINKSVETSWEGVALDLEGRERYWGAIEETADRELMLPRVLLLDSVMEFDQELGDFMRYLVFIPIGMTDEGKPG